jgi:hypothetical protein
MASEENVKGEGFEILGHQPPASETEQPEAEQAQPEAPAEEAAPPEGEPAVLQQIDVYAMMRVSLAQFAAVAWQKMGLQADPFTNQVDKDIEQARLAIDLVAVLVERLAPHLQGQEARDYQSLLTDLRLNFVKQAG